MSQQLILKVQTKLGSHKLDTLAPTDTIADLKRHLSNLSKIPVDRLHVLSGFPPKVFDTSDDTQKLTDSGLVYGETLILEERAAPPPAVTAAPPAATVAETPYRPHVTEPAPPSTDCAGILMKKVVPADNSCLFSSIYFVLNGRIDDSGAIAPLMRNVIAETIARNREQYCEAILGKPVDDYCAWIQDDKSWGGAIELAILSKYYGIEIAVVNTVSANLNRFGEDQQYGHRVFLMFDGIHYDPLFLEPVDGTTIQTLFPTDDERLLHDAEQLGKEAKSSRQFTDVNKFTLKCMDCNIFLSGQTQAQDHAKTTGHTNFGEV